MLRSEAAAPITANLEYHPGTMQKSIRLTLWHVIREYLAHYHAECNHQGIENVIPFPDGRLECQQGIVAKAERPGGLLNFYYRQAV